MASPIPARAAMISLPATMTGRPGVMRKATGHRLVAEFGGDHEDPEQQRQQVAGEARAHQVPELLDGVGIVGAARTGLAVVGATRRRPPPPLEPWLRKMTRISRPLMMMAMPPSTHGTAVVRSFSHSARTMLIMLHLPASA